MSEYIFKQQSLLNSVARALDNFKKIGQNYLTAAKIRSRMTAVKETWTKCVDGHATLLHVYPEDKRKGVEYISEDKLAIYEEHYNTTLDYMADCLEEAEPCVSANRPAVQETFPSDSSSLSLKYLLPIQLPPFSGTFDEWENFRDRFQALIINNKGLSNFTRMHFLASSLTGRARDAIANLNITADNFGVAWTALLARFENKRRLIEIHVTNLYNLPRVSRESATELHKLRDKAETAIAALKRLDRSPEQILSDILVYFVSQKLDPATRRAWKLKFGDEVPPPTYDDLNRFLSSRARALEELAPPTQAKQNRNHPITTASTDSAPSCSLCKQRHFLNKCPQFIEKSSSQRREIVQKFKRCFNCLSTKHAAAECKSRFSCRICQQKHHSMLHLDSNAVSNTNLATTFAPEPSVSSDSTISALSAISSTIKPSPVLLATAKVIVSSPSGNTQTVRALLDQGSEVSFITENIAQLLRLRRIRTLTSISAVGGVSAGTCRHAVQLHITPRNRSGPTFTALVLVMKSLTKYAPRQSQFDARWSHLAKLQLADDDPTGSSPIDLLIGADLYSSIILNGIRKGSVDQSIAQNSHFGWVLSGPTASLSSPPRSIKVLHCSLERELHKFWEIEELPHQTILSPEHFRQNYSRAEDGKYIVRLPFKADPPIDIGDSLSTAQRVLTTLNRRLDRQPALKQEYSAFLSEYEALGHMEKVLDSPPSSSSSQIIYIPHHMVIRDSSSTTRLRVVFNASCKTINGSSLNNHLLAGPKLQTDVV